jgi:hypothetical protein
MSRRFEIISYFSSIRQPNRFLSKDHMDRLLEVKRIPLVAPSYKIPKVMHVQVSPHAVDRWNERVGPVVTKPVLEDMIGSLINQWSRILFLSPTLGLIDHDILFTYQRQRDSIVITTFYGRLAENPSLHNFAALRNYNRFDREHVNLRLTEERIHAQKLPPIPRQTLVFKGRRNRYHIEEYLTSEGSYISVVVWESQTGKRKRWGFLMNDCSHAIYMNRSIQHALCLMGFKAWVRERAEEVA